MCIHPGGVDESQSRHNGKRPATEFGCNQGTHQAKRSRQQQGNTAELGGRPADDLAGPSTRTGLSPRNRKQAEYLGMVRWDNYAEAIEELSSSTNDSNEPTNPQDTNNRSSTTPHLPTPSPGPRENTIETVGRSAGDWVMEEFVPIDDLEESPPTTPPATRRNDSAPQNMPTSEHELEQVQEALLEPVPGPQPVASHEILGLDLALEDAHENALRSALERAVDQRADHNTNLQLSGEGQLPLPPVRYLYSVDVSEFKNSELDSRRGFWETSLQELVDDVIRGLPSGGNFSGLSFLLETGGRQFDIKVDLGDERKFQSIRDRFQRKIELARETNRGQNTLIVDIAIAPIGY